MKANNKIYTILSVFFLLALSLLIFVVCPLIVGIKKNSEDLVSEKNNIATFSAQINETAAFQKNYPDYEPTFQKIDESFVDSNNPVDFFNFLDDTAAKSGVTSQISLPASSGDAAESDAIIFQFVASGKFSQISDFTNSIENGPYLIEVEDLTILPEVSAKSFDATFSIKAFIKQ